MKQRIYFSILIILVFSTICIGRSAERIFYSTFSPQDWDIYISKDDGKSFKKFTDHPSLDYDAVISPDGKWVVFTSERSGTPKLYVQAIEGKQSPSVLFKSNSFQDQATFSPDGSQLAFVASHEGNSEIYIIPFLPDSVQNISTAINLTNHPGGDFRPSFSPNGKQIAFSSDRGHEIVPHTRFPFARQRIGDVYSVDILSKNSKRLTDSEFWDGSPQWSADGTKIIFYSGRTGKNSIFEMNSDGTNQKQIIDFTEPAVSPKYLPNGNITFTTWKNEQDFKIMQADKATSEITTLFSDGPDLMFNVDIHPSGLMVFHGGSYPKNQGEQGNFGFDGDVLAKLPNSLSFSDKKIEAFGVRRAFVAPPQIGNNLLFYDASDIKGKRDSLLTFYQIDYKTGEKKLIFKFDREPNIDPANFSVLDSKVTPDGKAFIFTTGSFRANASTQGDIWKYDFENKIVTKLSDSPFNDGFGDFSENGKMVFRSGRSEHFDIYLKTNDEIINLTQDSHRDNFPSISKQGDKIVFSSDRLRTENEYKTMDIFLMKLNQDNSWSEPEKISVGKGQNAHAHFSPDGEWVIYTTEGYGINDEQALIQPIIFSPQMYGEIVAYNINTKERIRLTHNKWEEGTPLWVK